MPNVSEIKKSNFLKKEDCGTGILVTIAKVTQENVAKEGADEEMRWCLHFVEPQVSKPMVLNSTNAQLIAQITKHDNTDDWTGFKVVLYSDPSITYGGKLVGGIRVRAPRGLAAAKLAQAAAPPVSPASLAEPEADDVPF
jgi:hypothetical protein